MYPPKIHENTISKATVGLYKGDVQAFDSSLSKSWSSIIYEIYDHSHDGDWDHHHPNIVFFCQTPPGLSNSCSERNSFCAWSLSRCSSLRALACQQVLVFSVTSFVYMRIYPPCILSIWLTINMQTTTLITFKHVWPVHTYVEIRISFQNVLAENLPVDQLKSHCWTSSTQLPMRSWCCGIMADVMWKSSTF